MASTTRRRRRKSAIARFVQDVVDHTRDFVDDVLDRACDVEDDVPCTARDIVDGDKKLSDADLRELSKAVLLLRVKIVEFAAAETPA